MEPNKQLIIHSLVENFIFQLLYTKNFLNHVEVNIEEDFTHVHAPWPNEDYNFAVNFRLASEAADRRVKELIDLFRSKGVPFTIWHTPLDTPLNLPEIFKKYGLQDRSNCSDAMVLDLTQAHLKSDHKLTIHPVYHLNQMQDFANLQTAFGEDVDSDGSVWMQIPAALYQKGAPMELYVGYLESKAVACGMLIQHAGVCGLYYIATDPSEQRKGYGKEMLYHLIQRAKNLGFPWAVLEASNEGKPLYQRAGFKTICQIVEYSLL